MTQKALEKKIKEAQDAYYNDDPIMEDSEFDKLWDLLQKKYPDSKLLKEVGKDHDDGFKKAKHLIRAGSQQKATNEEEVEKCLKKSSRNVTISDKLDGSSLVMYYKKGKLDKALSRGDGFVGDVMTKNVLKMNGVITELKDKIDVSVRGEVLLSRKNKDRYYSDMKNCRNAGNGIFKRKDGKGCEHLDIVTYDAQVLKGKPFSTQTEMMKFLERNGFKVVWYKKLSNATVEDLMEILKEKFNNFNELEYDIDGLVVKSEKYDVEDMQETRPTKQFAIKPEKIEAVTTLKDIKWQMKSGTFTPVGIVDPVQLNGTTVKRANLCNLNNIIKLGIKIGDKVIVVKCGMIIPQITAKYKGE